MTISLQYIVKEIDRLGWPYTTVDEEHGLLSVTPEDCQAVLFRITSSEFVSALGIYTSNKKDLSYKICAEVGVRMPQTIKYVGIDESENFLKKVSRVVLKPSNGAHGLGVSTGITNLEDLKCAVGLAESLGYSDLLLQEQAQGQDVRALFIGDEYVGAIIRHPAKVVGDGRSTIEELILQENKKDHRGINYAKDMNEIDYASAKQYLGKELLGIPELGREVQVIGAANVGLGGTSEDISDSINPYIIKQAKLAKDSCLTTHAGVDFMVPDPCADISDLNPLSFIEINSGPMLAFHEKPNVGLGAPVSRIYLNWLREQALIRDELSTNISVIKED